MLRIDLNSTNHTVTNTTLGVKTNLRLPSESAALVQKHQSPPSASHTTNSSNKCTKGSLRSGSDVHGISSPFWWAHFQIYPERIHEYPTEGNHALITANCHTSFIMWSTLTKDHTQAPEGMRQIELDEQFWAHSDEFSMRRAIGTQAPVRWQPWPVKIDTTDITQGWWGRRVL